MDNMLLWAVSSAVMILVVLAVRALTKSRLSCRARYCLWLLVLVRLLVPTQLFTASWGVSVPELTARMTEQSVYVLPVERTPVIRMDRDDLNRLRESNPSLVITPADANSFGYSRLSPDGTEDVRYAAKWSVADILRVVWLTGALAMALVLLVSNLRFALRFRRTRVPYDAPNGDRQVYVAEGIPSPCLVGVFRPSVYLTPEAIRDGRTLRHVLAHEETHRRHGDGVWSLLRLIALCLHWYNPLVWLAVVLSKRDGELACDEATLARLGEDERVPYGETLLTLVRTKPNPRELLSASTAMTAGKKTMRERIETIARHPRTKAVVLLLAVAVLLTATACAFAKGTEKRPADEPPQTEPAAPQQTAAAPSGTYASVEDYLDTVRAKAGDTATLYTYDHENGDGTVSEPYQTTAKVLDTRIHGLERRAMLSDLAPDGTLELYNYSVLCKTDIPVEKIVFVGGMYSDDEYADLEGQGGHALIVLRHDDGSVDVLHDAPQNDDMGGLWYFHDSEREALYDWAVKHYDLDLPLYTIDLLPAVNTLDGGYPAHRVDGDGWYFYLPVQAWYRADDGETARWFSQYNTGSMLSIRHLASADECDIAPRAEHWDRMDGKVKKATYEDAEKTQTAYLYEAQDGGYWQVLTEYYNKTSIHSDLRGVESSALEAMARSFTLDAHFHAPERDPAAELRNFVKTLYDEQPLDVTLSLFDGGASVVYDAGGTPNAFHVCYELRMPSYTEIDADAPPAGASFMRLEALGYRMDVDGNTVYFRGSDGVTHGLRSADMGYGADYLENNLRLWYDEAELRALGGGYDNQADIVIPDRGQGYLAAAQEHCDTLAAVNLHVSPGSAYGYTWVRCTVKEEKEQTEHFRSIGRIDENTWAITMTEIFVPENEMARNYSMAGNTEDYVEYIRDYAPEAYDPSVPVDAYIRWQCGYVKKDAEGYHTQLVGTGW